ncbi:MAG TPA: type II toxin-antitoxin system Phd/YefM family antitoxin [Terriglobales bacterium]|nr:type II toxin-antitoxin system Phd/YefM family antitoxin [Terriglobales bacterium]
MHQTKTNLSKILKEVEEGREVVIARGDKPIAKIVPIQQPSVRRQAGSLKGKLTFDLGFFAPLTDEELKDWGID